MHGDARVVMAGDGIRPQQQWGSIAAWMSPLFWAGEERGVCFNLLKGLAQSGGGLSAAKFSSAMQSLRCNG